MSGFEAWAGTFHASMAIAACALVAGMILGWLAGSRPRGLSRRKRRELADAAAERAAVRQIRQWRPQLEVAHEESPGYMMGYRLHVNGEQVYDWRHDDPEPFSPEAAAAGWEAHVGAALAVANGDPITTGEIRAITEDMDVFMARLLGEHPVPWPDGSGQ